MASLKGCENVKWEHNDKNKKSRYFVLNVFISKMV